MNFSLNQRVFPLSRSIFLLPFALFSSLLAAELFARKMEIIRTSQGQATLFRDSVTIQDGGTLIVCGRGLMYEALAQAILSGSVYIQTPEVAAWADSVEYDFRLRRAYLWAHPNGMVLVKQDSIEIAAPQIEYYFQTGVVTAPSGLELKNIAAEFILTGRQGSYNLHDRTGVVDSLPVLRVKLDSGAEPVTVTARKMFWNQNGGMVKGEGSVNVRAAGCGLGADTALFFPDHDSGVAWGNPLVQDSAGSAQAETMVFRLSDGVLRQVILSGRSEGSYRTVTGDTVLVRSRGLNLFLSDGKIERIEVADLLSGELIRRSTK
ncbi:MAG: hypothetical protein ACUVUR_07155 [bacterium]